MSDITITPAIGSSFHECPYCGAKYDLAPSDKEYDSTKYDCSCGDRFYVEQDNYKNVWIMPEDDDSDYYDSDYDCDNDDDSWEDNNY